MPQVLEGVWSTKVQNNEMNLLLVDQDIRANKYIKLVFPTVLKLNRMMTINLRLNWMLSTYVKHRKTISSILGPY